MSVSLTNIIGLTAVFCKEKRPDVRRSHPNASIPEQAMVLSEMWRAMTDTNKDKYRNMAVAV